MGEVYRPGESKLGINQSRSRSLGFPARYARSAAFFRWGIAARSQQNRANLLHSDQRSFEHILRKPYQRRRHEQELCPVRRMDGGESHQVRNAHCSDLLRRDRFRGVT